MPCLTSQFLLPLVSNASKHLCTMISLGKQALTIEGVQVYRDHANPNQFWYLPGPVQLARRPADDRPDFTLVSYRKSGTNGAKGGGFLSFGVDCHLSEDRRGAIRDRVGEQAPDEPLLAAVPFQSGTVRCIAFGEQSAPSSNGSSSSNGSVPEGAFRAVEEILGASKPALQGRNEAIFGLTLSKEGAAIAEEVFKEGGTPLGVIYNLTFSAMRPALKVEVHADLDQVYQRLGGSLEGQVYFVEAGLDATFEKMRQEGIIEVKVRDFSSAEDRKKKTNWALDLFKNQLMEEWFTPTLTTGTLEEEASDGEGSGDSGSVGDGQSSGQGGSQGDSSASSSSNSSSSTASTASDVATAAETGSEAAEDASGKPQVSLKLNFVRKELRKEVTVRYDRSEAVKRSYNPQGNLGLLAEDLDKSSSHFIRVDLDEGFFRTMDVSVQAPVDMEHIGLLSAQVMIQFGDPENPGEFRQEDFVFEKGDQEPKTFTTFLNEDGDFSYDYTIEYHFDSGSDWSAETTSYKLPEQTKQDRSLVLNPTRDLGFLDVEVFPNEIDAGIVTSTEVHLRYTAPSGWTADDMIILEPDSEPQRWKVRTQTSDPGSYEYRLVHHLDDGTTREVSWETRSLDSLPVNDPFEASLDIEFVRAFDSGAEGVRGAFAEVRYEDSKNDYMREERVDLLEESNTIRLALMDPDNDRFSYRTTIVTPDNEVEQSAWTETTNTLIPIEWGE